MVKHAFELRRRAILPRERVGSDEQATGTIALCRYFEAQSGAVRCYIAVSTVVTDQVAEGVRRDTGQP
jgi:hypothetical protein